MKQQHELEIKKQIKFYDQSVMDITKISFGPHSQINPNTFYILQCTLEALLADNKFRIIIDFENVSYVSSAGLGVLMAFLSEFRENKGDLKLIRMLPKIRNLFDMLGFSRLLKIYSTEEDAVSAFQEEKQTAWAEGKNK